MEEGRLKVWFPDEMNDWKRKKETQIFRFSLLSMKQDEQITLLSIIYM